MLSRNRIVLVAALFGLLVGTWSVAPRTMASGSTTVRGERGVVVSDSREASRVGIKVLNQGGSAVDAAVAVAMALAVTLPEAGNLGGGGFMMVLPAPGATPVCVEYRETAPAAATPTMFRLGESHLGYKAIGTPGTVRGLALAQRRFGKLAWKRLVEPAVELATQGFPLSRRLAASLNRVLADSAAFAEFRRVYGKDAGRAAWQAGDRLVLPDLAATLRQIADSGPNAFYQGDIARRIVAEIHAGGGLINAGDLAAYQAHVRPSITGTFHGYQVCAPPPPSSGGIVLVEMLNVLENFDLHRLGPRSPPTWHRVIETMRRAYRDRAAYLGDTDFVKIPKHLTTKTYARRLAGEIDLRRATPSEALAGDIPLAGESPHTTHFSIIDADGMAVANTYTLEQSYGSRVVVRGAGFLLNNEMGDFNWKPGHTDRRGNIGTPANVIAPGKRMLSSQTPTLVLRDGRAVLITGSPGGRTIINTVLCVLLNRLEFGLSPRESVDAPRWHQGWFPDMVRFEGVNDPRYAETVTRLRAMGHLFSDKAARQGSAHTIWIDPRTGRRVGVADTRRDGFAAAQ